MRRPVITLVSVLLFGLAPPLARADPVLTAPPTLTHEQALEVDAYSYAADFDVTVEEALRRLHAQHAIPEIVGAAQAELGPRFAGAWIEHTPAYRQ